MHTLMLWYLVTGFLMQAVLNHLYAKRVAINLGAIVEDLTDLVMDVGILMCYHLFARSAYCIANAANCTTINNNVFNIK